MSDKETRMREAICALGAKLAARGLCPGTSGNISARIDDGWLMTPTNSSLGELEPDPAALQPPERTGAGAGDLEPGLLDVRLQRGDDLPLLHQIAAIDQHLVARGRENDLISLLRTHPHLLGIGLDEGAGLVVTGDVAKVLGRSVAIYDVTDPLSLIPLRWLAPGAVYDLGARHTVLTEQSLEVDLASARAEAGAGH